jgi:hypothetical protein
VLCESHLDALAWYQAGFPAYALGGAARGLTKEALDVLHKKDEITVFVQNKDAAAKDFAKTTLSSLEGTLPRKFMLQLPDAFEDAADVLDAPEGAARLAEYFGTREYVEDPNRRTFSIKEFLWLADASNDAIWGSQPDDILWASGEECIILGPISAGKTTLAQGLLRGLLGLDPLFLGYPVEPNEGRVLYIAGDRWRQTLRAFRRIFTDRELELIERRLFVHKGPPPFDMGKQPMEFVEWVLNLGPELIVLDSQKDCAVALESGEAGSGYNKARQELLAEDVEILSLAHPRKARQGDPNANLRLDDLYGSTWVGAGAGQRAFAGARKRDVGSPLKAAHTQTRVESGNGHDAHAGQAIGSVYPLGAIRPTSAGARQEQAWSQDDDRPDSVRSRRQQEQQQRHGQAQSRAFLSTR